jgi:hypothetical protein
LEKGVREVCIRFDIEEAGSGHISQSIEDIGLKDKKGLLINGQA